MLRTLSIALVVAASCGDSIGAGEGGSSPSTTSGTSSPTTAAVVTGAGAETIDSATDQNTTLVSGTTLDLPDGVECTSREHRCDGQDLQACSGDGTWVSIETCDVRLGLTCDALTGSCVGTCSGLSESDFRGCEFYPVTTAQFSTAYVHSNFAVSVENATAATATVTVVYDGDVIEKRDIAPGSVGVVPLPRIKAIGVAHESKLVAGAAYHLFSTNPVTLYQHNTIQADASNDTSLLLPVNAWGEAYVVASLPHWEPFNVEGIVAIVASEDDTTVTVKPRNGGTPTEAGGGVDAQGNGVVVMNAGDVLQLLTDPGGDYTGTVVVANKRVQVLGGHLCTSVPADSFACDHLEESMLPIKALGREYVVVPPAQFLDEDLDKPVFVRIIAAEDGVNLTYTPDQPAKNFLPAIGDFVEIGPTVERFVIKADKKILVAEYVVSQDFGYGTGDASMLLAIPREYNRDQYRFHADTTWDANFVDIVAPTDAQVELDGQPVLDFTPIGASGLGHAHVRLSNSGDGTHQVLADERVNISVYGYCHYGSYWYPGGLDLGLVPG